MLKFINEIKNRIFLLLSSWLSLFFVFYYYKSVCVLLIIFSNYNISNQILNYFIFTSVQEVFVIYINFILFLTQYIVYYVIFYHLICYFSWGLFKFEYKQLKRLFTLSMFLGAYSFLFFQFIIMPAILHFFLSFHMKIAIGLFFEAKLSEFLIFYKMTFKNCFLIFQFCGLLILLTNYFNFTSKLLKITRKPLYLILLIFSTILTPPDVYSQLLSFFLFVCCFELFVLNKFLNVNLSFINLEDN